MHRMVAAGRLTSSLGPRARGWGDKPSSPLARGLTCVLAAPGRKGRLQNPHQFCSPRTPTGSEQLTSVTDCRGLRFTPTLLCPVGQSGDPSPARRTGYVRRPERTLGSTTGPYTISKSTPVDRAPRRRPIHAEGSSVVGTSAASTTCVWGSTAG